MAGSSMTLSKNEGLDTGQARPGVRVFIFTWTSDASAGTASMTTTEQVVGELVKVVAVPGSPTPSDNYSIVIKESTTGVDISGSCDKALATNQKAASATETYLLVKNYDGTPLATSAPPIVCDFLNVAVSSAGNSKQGSIYLYVRTRK